VSDDAAKYISDQQQRLLAVVMTLAGHEIEGLAPGEIAKLVPCAPSQVTRDLANLKSAGWAEQITTTNRWRLGTLPVQMAMRHMTAMDRARKKLDETSARYTRT
jgi:DNA-binding IclR family transcriptional regulator